MWSVLFASFLRYKYPSWVCLVVGIGRLNAWWLGSSSATLLRVRVNISAQWLIGRFVRVSHSKSELINCAGGEKTNSF
ncbi:hypothetical protein CWI26_10740 [Streptococcus suis]|uniref:Uncharacterized protein n=1 Tax=Streptococcus suis TaxID=1307 RepID=A0A2I5KRC6_STRSU|nr:hypothetical protein CWI26_10740 [Streptococcus suis]